MSLDYHSVNMPLGDDEDDYSDSGDDMDVGSDDDVEVKGAGSQLADSAKGMVVGLLCFIISWPVLWCGATRTQESKEFAKAVAIDQAKEGEQAFVTGNPVSGEIGDPPHLKAGKYLKISKSHEVYAIKSIEKSETQKKGTKKVTRKWHEYSFEWTTNPRPIQGREKSRWKDFARQNNLPVNLQNPPAKDKPTDTIVTPNLSVNNISVNVRQVEFMGGGKEADKVYLKGNKDNPKIGDERISYTVYPADQQWTFSGKKAGSTIAPVVINNTAKIVGAPGTQESLIAAKKSEDRLYFWLYLIIGFVLMAAGLNGMVGPVTTLLDFIPFIGELGAGLIRLVLALIAAVLSIVFYVVIYFAKNFWWLVLIIVAAVIIFLVMRKKSAKPAAA